MRQHPPCPIPAQNPQNKGKVVAKTHPAAGGAHQSAVFPGLCKLPAPQQQRTSGTCMATGSSGDMGFWFPPGLRWMPLSRWFSEERQNIVLMLDQSSTGKWSGHWWGS